MPLLEIPLLFVGDYRISKYIHNHPGIQGRQGDTGPIFQFFHDVRLHTTDRIYGVSTSQGSTWKEQRNFMVKTLNKLGLGRSSLEEMVAGEVERFCQHLENREGTPEQVVDLFNLPVLGMLWELTTGEHVQYEDIKLRQFSADLNGFLHFVGTPAALLTILFPWIKKTVPSLVKYQEQFYRNLSNEMQKLIDGHRKDIDEDNPRDFIDHFLIEMGNMAEENTSVDVKDQDEKLRTILIDIFIGGTATTANVLSFGFLFLVRNPEVQTLVQEEISCVFGTAVPTVDLMGSMPHTQATISEILRCANVLPVLPRSTTEDVVVDGVTIPKDTIILNIYTEIMKGSSWQEGELFNPQRFLDESGHVVTDERVIAFGAGKRICPGKHLANIQLFLYFTRILQLFSVHPETEGVMPEEAVMPGLTTSPMPFKVRFCKRK